MRKKETQALIKSPTGKGVPLKLNARLEKSECLPTRAPIRGVSKSLVNAATTPPKAAPITTPTAISTTLPRRMNFLKPSSIEELLFDRSKGNVCARNSQPPQAALRFACLTMHRAIQRRTVRWSLVKSSQTAEMG